MLTSTSLFAGAGGDTEGFKQVPGVEVLMAANHWRLAMDTHQLNHPDTAHDCADISQVDPRRYPSTDLLWASPECTNHSQARGKRRDDRVPDAEGNLLPDEAAERSRATMWDVPRFAEYHQYRAVVVENVVDAALWCPTNCRTCAARGGPKGCGSLFRAWLAAMDACGYQHQVLYLNSMFAQAGGDGAAQSRDRKYTLFTRHGDKAPDLDKWTRPRAHCTSCDEWVFALQSWRRPDLQWGRYGKQYDYRCPNARCRAVVHPPVLGADTTLNLSHPVVALGDRKKPLADKTMRRCVEGFDMYRRALQVPLEGRDGKQATPLNGPWRTMTTRRETGVLIPMRNNSSVRLLSEPFHTFCASGNHQAVALPRGLMDDLMDWGLRCVEPDEITLAMAFPRGYQMLGTKREQARLAGNAVTPPAARDIGFAVAEALLGDLRVAA